MTDEQRHDWLGYSSSEHFETPNIDWLAKTGVRFDQAYSSSTTCQPARTALLTGLHHHRSPRQEGSLALREGAWTVARELQAAGYETALIGRMHLSPIHADHGFETMRMCEIVNPGSGYGREERDDYGLWLDGLERQDWREVQPDGDGGLLPAYAGSPRTFPDFRRYHPTQWIEQETMSFLERRDHDRPLFLIVSFPHPHAPFDPPYPYASMFSPDESVLPIDGFEANRLLTGGLAEDVAGVSAVFRVDQREPDALPRILASIRGLVKQIDDSIGSILDGLDMESSLIFFTSDHGDYGGHRGLLTKVPWIPFDDLIRVPFLVSGGALAGSPLVSQALVQNSSFAATCLDYAGVSVPGDAFDFPSLRPVLEGTEDADEDRAVFSSFSMGYPMVRRGRFKLIATMKTEVNLFDLERDPGETVSVADDPAYAGIADELLALIEREYATRPASMVFGPTMVCPDVAPARQQMEANVSGETAR